MAKVTNPLTGTTETEIDWTNSDDDMYSVTTHNPDGSVPVTHYDVLGRPVLQATDRYEGGYVFVQSEYNNDGTLKRVSLPNSTFSNIQWETYTYDFLNRPTHVTSPGKNMAYFYNGLSSRVTDSVTGQTSTTLANGLGQTIEVTGTNGTVAYTYNVAGQLRQTLVDGETVEYKYDLHGNTIESSSINNGTSYAAYNSLGQIEQSITSNGDTLTYTYDDMGRLETLVSPDDTRTYTYVETGNGQGRLHAVQSTSGFGATNTYDAYGRVLEYTEHIDGDNYTVGYTYDNLSRVSRLDYPTDYYITYNYDQRGMLEGIADKNNNTVWELNTTNDLGLPTGFTLGNGLTTTMQYNTIGQVTDIVTGTVQDQHYTYYTNNLMHTRTDNNLNLTETFTYDSLLRLTTYGVNNNPACSLAYATNGNIESKSGVGGYTYAQSAHPNAVTSIANDQGIVPSCNQQISYNHFNKPTLIEENNDSLAFSYGTDGMRRKTTLTQSGVIKKEKVFLHGLYEKITDSSGTTRELHYIPGPMGLAAIYKTEGTTDSMFYVHKDHLGSVSVITDQTGNVHETMAFGPWGRRRNPTNWTYTNVPAPKLTDRGFTLHEELPEFGLINMNGRTFDPLLARFLNADPIIQAPGNAQNYNSYSYCFNNPLSCTDPSGYANRPILDNGDDYIERRFKGSRFYDGYDSGPIGYSGRLGPTPNNTAFSGYWDAIQHGYVGGYGDYYQMYMDKKMGFESSCGSTSITFFVQKTGITTFVEDGKTYKAPYVSAKKYTQTLYFDFKTGRTANDNTFFKNDFHNAPKLDANVQEYGEIYYDEGAKGISVDYGKAKKVRYAEEWISKWGAMGGSFDSPQSWDAFWSLLQAISGVIDENTNPLTPDIGYGVYSLPPLPPDTVRAPVQGDTNQFDLIYIDSTVHINPTTDIWGEPDTIRTRYVY